MYPYLERVVFLRLSDQLVHVGIVCNGSCGNIALRKRDCRRQVRSAVCYQQMKRTIAAAKLFDAARVESVTRLFTPMRKFIWPQVICISSPSELDIVPLVLDIIASAKREF